MKAVDREYSFKKYENRTRREDYLRDQSKQNPSTFVSRGQRVVSRQRWKVYKHVTAMTHSRE